MLRSLKELAGLVEQAALAAAAVGGGALLLALLVRGAVA